MESLIDSAKHRSDAFEAPLPGVPADPEAQAPAQAETQPAFQPQIAAPEPQPFAQAPSETFIGADHSAVKEAKIVVVGAGGMGGNAVNRLQSLGVNGAITVAVNTDKQHLEFVKADRKVLIGQEITRGLGAGGYPNVGKQAAEESSNELRDIMRDVDLVFLVAGMGGGTGTGAAPVVADVGKKEGAIVIGVTTMPFKIEGGRLSKAEEGLARLRQVCDTVIVIENEKLLEVAGSMPLQQAFAVADEIIVTMIKGITETIATPSLVNLDYADIKAVMTNGGVAVIGVGESSTASRAREAVTEAMSNPLLDVDYKDATGAIIHIAGGPEMTLDEINEIGEFVSKHLDPNAQTIWGARIDDSMAGRVRVITIITGVQSQYILGPTKNEQPSVKNLGAELGIKMA